MSDRIQKIYLLLTLLNTLASSFIWGINTLFLLDAGLTNLAAFGANAFFTAGQVIFEIPTGIVADIFGRRTSYLSGALTLSGATFLYFLAWRMHAPFWSWAVTSVLLGLGFTFFSGATEAWLVDALNYTKFKGNLESVFAKGQIVSGGAMLTGSISGGIIAQFTNLGVPYLLRILVLLITFIAAFFLMKDLGFKAKKKGRVFDQMNKVFKVSINLGLSIRPVRWIMLAGIFSTGVSFYAFYAAQPYLLKLYGDEKAFGVAGLAAAIVAGAEIIGGMAVPLIRRVFRRRTTIVLTSIFASILLLAALGVIQNFYAAILILIIPP